LAAAVSEPRRFTSSRRLRWIRSSRFIYDNSSWVRDKSPLFGMGARVYALQQRSKGFNDGAYS
jgi:hypothetical protein